MSRMVKTVFKHQNNKGGTYYSVAVSGKDAEGEQAYVYWYVDFPKGSEIPDRARIEFKDYYITFYTKQDGTVQYKFVVQDYLEARDDYGQQRPQQRQQQRPFRPQRQKWQESFEELNDDCPF